MKLFIATAFVLILSSAGAFAQAPVAATVKHERAETISKADYITTAQTMAEKRFAKMDSNKDGILSKEERQAAHGVRKSGGRHGCKDETTAKTDTR